MKKEYHLSCIVKVLLFYALGALLTIGLDLAESATFYVTNTNDSGAGSLRQAILNANSNLGADTIEVTGVATTGTVVLNTALPDINDATGGTTLNGNGLTIDGKNLTGTKNGIVVKQSNNNIRGLKIKNFPYAGILLDQLAYNNTIGGTNAIERNIIIKNQYGVIFNGTSGSNRVVGNYIGVDADGITPAGNTAGIIAARGSSHCLIGGSTPAHGNVICGNTAAGIILCSDIGFIGSPAHNFTIQYNKIGVGADGTTSVPNGTFGIQIYQGAYDNAILRNTIANNGRDGIRVSGSITIGNTLSQNSIYNNNWKGIELESGGNTEPPPPVITSVTGGLIKGTAATGTTVEIFKSPDEEGKQYLGTAVASKDKGHWSFAYDTWRQEGNITATGMDINGNTSEFSTPFPIPGVVPTLSTWGIILLLLVASITLILAARKRAKV